MTQDSSRNDPTAFLLDLEQKVKSLQVRSVRLPEGSNDLFGLCLFDDALPGPVKKILLDGIARLSTACATASTGKGRTGTAREEMTDPVGLPDSVAFRAVLQTEMTRHQKNRMPCALLFIAPDDISSSNTLEDNTVRLLIDVLRTSLQPGDIPARFDAVTFAVILPNTNRNRAYLRAKMIREAFKAKQQERTDRHLTLSIGLGIASLEEEATADDDFVAKTRQEMNRARDMGGDRICRCAEQQIIDSCQVTVEERAHLFSFLTKDMS